MESKDPLLPISSLPGLRTRSSRIPPIGVHSVVVPLGEQQQPLLVDAEHDPSPSPSLSMSPRTPADSAPLSGAATEPSLESPGGAAEAISSSSSREPASGPQRTRSGSAASKLGETREKRKRSRVTPEQLTHLERFFAADRSPTAARRREISELLGMQERQTQIWFQNRRAKAKLLDGKKSRQSGGEWSDTPPDTPPQLSAGYEADLHSLIHEDQPVSIIPCTDLSIGTWRRIATGKHDLVAYVCEAKQCLTWFIHSSGYGFKMEIPFDTIAHTEFRNAGPGEGLASFTLSQPPLFYLENITSPRSAGGYGTGLVKSWKKCSDWTEGTQASLVLRHDLIGSAVQLAHVLTDLRNYRTRASLPLISPASLSSSGDIISPSPGSSMSVQIPQPPLAALQGTGYSGHLERPDLFAHARKRSSSDTSIFAHHPPSSYPGNDYSSAGGGGSFHGMLSGPRSASYASSSFSSQLPLTRPPPIATTMPYTHSYGPRSSVDFLSHDHPSTSPTQHHEAPVSGDYSTVPISHASMHRPSYSSPSAHYPEPHRNSPPYHFNALKQEPDASGLVTHYPSSSSLDVSYQAPHSADSSLVGGSSSQNMGSLAHNPSAISPSAGDGTSIPHPHALYYAQDASQHQQQHSQPQSLTSPGRLDSTSLSGALGSSSTTTTSSSSPTGPRQMMPPQS